MDGSVIVIKGTILHIQEVGYKSQQVQAISVLLLKNSFKFEIEESIN